MMSGEATAAQIGALLMGMRLRGETVTEIAGGVRVMRAKALSIDAPEGAIDTVGTGGDAAGTYNVSTAAAFVVAATGVPVAKHGNRALSSKSGAADVLTELGVNVDCDMALVQKGAVRHRDLFHDGAAPPRGDAPRRACPCRNGRADDLQPAGAVGQSGRR